MNSALNANMVLFVVETYTPWLGIYVYIHVMFKKYSNLLVVTH